MLALVASANENMPSERRVSHGTAIRIADRSMLETEGLPFSVREHRAAKDISDFISVAQHNKTNLPQPKNTDLLVVGHPRSTKPHAMTASALKRSQARWMASDPRIEDEEIRVIVSSALSAAPNTPEHDYYRIRLIDLPAGSVPRALVAAFGDGNSSAARSARARMQRRDRKGRFAWMGGGLRALVRRAGGIFSLSGRMVGQGVGTDDTFDMELPNGRLVRVPAQRAEGLKAVITRPGTDGYSPSPARMKSGDPVVDESELISIDAPNGFREDSDYSGPGVRYTDDAYDVVRFDAADPEAPELPEGVTRDPNRPILAASRRDGDKAGEIFEVSQSWANIQDKIRADEVDLDRSEGRNPDPIATLDDAEFERLRETVGDSDRDPMEVLREMRGEQAPAADRRGTPDMADFDFNSGDDAYVFDTTEEYMSRGPRRGDSAEYTDEPELLADMFDSDDLIDAMRQGVLPDEDGNEGSGRGALDFGEGDELVPVEAIHAALREQGADADMELARIYDENNGNTDNVDRLSAFRGGEQAAEPKAELPEDEETPLEATMPPLFEGLSRGEQQRILDTGEWGQYLPENADVEVPEGYYTPDLENFENVDEIPEHDPLNNTREYTQEQLEAAYRESLEPSATPGYGNLTKTDADGEETSASVPAESLRDSLKMMNVDTDELTERIASEGREGQEDIDDAEAARILEDEDGQLAWDFTEEEVAQAKEDADALGYEGVSELIDEEPTLDEVVERVYAVGGDDLVRQVFGSRFEQDLYDRETAELVEEPTEEQLEKWTRMDRFLNFLERIGGGPGFIQSEFKPRDGSGDSQAQREKKAREARKRAKEEGEAPERQELRVPADEQAFIDELKKRRPVDEDEEALTPAEELADEKVKDEVEEWRERNRERAERDRERLPDVLQRRIDDIDSELDALDPDDEDSWIELVAERIRYQQMLDDLTNPAAGRGGGGGRRRPRRPAGGEDGEPRPREPRAPRAEAEREAERLTPEAEAPEDVAPEAEAERPSEQPEAEADAPEAEAAPEPAALPEPEEITKNLTEILDGADPNADPDMNGERRTGDRFRYNPDDPRNVFNQDYVNWLLAPERDEDEMSYADITNLGRIVDQMTDNEYAEIFGDQDREGFKRLIENAASNRQWDSNPPEGYTGIRTEVAGGDQPAWLARFNLDIEDTPETEAPEVPNYVAPDAEPAPEQESAPQRRRRLGRNRGKAAANGRDDAAPDVAFLDELRGGRQRLMRGAGDRLNAARDQLKKLYAGWDGRGRRMPRPEHIIVNRPEDPNIPGDAEYKDRYGRIIREGDIVAHRRVGDLINPDREAVNLIKGEVVGRETIIRPNENGVPTEYDGYLRVRVLESDDPEWVGEEFTYAAGETEIIRQNRTDEELSIGATREESAAQYLTRLSDESLYSAYFYINSRGGAIGGNIGPADRDANLKLISHELSARGLVNPQDLGDLLTFVTDDALETLPEDLGRNEGVQGRIFRELINNEKERRRVGGRQDRPGAIELPDLTPMLAQKARGEGVPDLAPEPREPEAPEAEAPEAPQAPEGNLPLRLRSLPPLDERAIPERYVPSDEQSIAPQGQAEGRPETNGVDNPNYGAINPDAANPNAQQIDYTSQGWDGQRAAEIAEAARSRVSMQRLAELVKAAQNGDRDAELEARKALKNIYGVDEVSLGKDGFTLEAGRITMRYDMGLDKIETQVEMRLLDQNGRTIGAVQRHLNFYPSEPDRSNAYNALFRIEQNQARGGGVTDSYNRWMENWYAANGIEKVNVTAAGGGDWTGGAVWALNNFSFASPSMDGRNKLRNLESAIGRMRAGEDKDAAKRDYDRLKARFEAAEAAGDLSMYPTPMHFALVGWRPGMKKDWVGYKSMASEGWSGVKSLSPNSINQRERVGYNEVMRVARRRIDAQENKFTPSDDLARKLSNENSYASGENSIIAPYRDEIIPFMRNGGGSLAGLSPAARQALSSWAVSQLEGQRSTNPEETVGLIYQLRDESIAYDRPNDSLGERAQILRSVTLSDLTDSSESDTEIRIGGQNSGFKARLLSAEESGINDTFMVTDTTTGQIFFIKKQSEEMTMQEIYGNVIGRALGARGAPFVDLADDRRLMITTFGGDGVANALYTERPADVYGWGEDDLYADNANFTLSDLASIGILDAVIANGDRHMGNFLMTHLGTYGVRGGSFESVLPILIDHGHAGLNRWAGSVEDYLISDSPASDIVTLLNYRLASMTPEARHALMRQNALRAIERLRAVQDPNMDQRATDIAIQRLQTVADMTVGDWANLEEPNRGYY